MEKLKIYISLSNTQPSMHDIRENRKVGIKSRVKIMSLLSTNFCFYGHVVAF